jgi:hypothetical protein
MTIVFLVVEKINGENNINYLTKYLTKGHAFPFVRRFGASRDLKRTRCVGSFVTKSKTAQAVTEKYKSYYLFDSYCINNRVSTFLLSSQNCVLGRAERAHAQLEMDLSNNNIKDERTLNIFNKFVRLMARAEYYDEQKNKNVDILNNLRANKPYCRKNLKFKGFKTKKV